MVSNPLYRTIISTPLGDMLAIASLHELFMLRFTDCTTVKKELKQLEQKTAAVIIPGSCDPIVSITKELHEYFAGKLTTFTTPINLTGTIFQQQTWNVLRTVQHGTTTSYIHIAQSLNKPTAFRAVANANSANKLAIIIPCHRIIGKNGSLRGYNGGIERKKWLLEHEKQLNFFPLKP